MPRPKPRKPGNYWRTPWRQARDNSDENPYGLWYGPKDERNAEALELLEDRRNTMNATTAVFYSQPLGRTYLSAEAYLHHDAATSAADLAYLSLGSSIRNASKNSVAEFLRMYSSASGRAWLIDVGHLRLADDDGYIVDAHGYRVDTSTPPALQDREFWNPAGTEDVPPNTDGRCPFCGDTRDDRSAAPDDDS